MRPLFSLSFLYLNTSGNVLLSLQDSCSQDKGKRLYSFIAVQNFGLVSNPWESCLGLVAGVGSLTQLGSRLQNIPFSL